MTVLDDWYKENLSPIAKATLQAWKEAEIADPRDEAECEFALLELLAELTARQKELPTRVIEH